MSTKLGRPTNGSGNGHASLVTVPALKDAKPSVFKPFPWMYQYAFHVARYLVENQRLPSQRALAELLGIHEVTLSKGLTRPGVHDWIREELRVHVGADANLSDKIKLRVAGKALQGDLEAARLWFQVTGELKPDVNKVNNGIVVVLGAPTDGL